MEWTRILYNSTSTEVYRDDAEFDTTDEKELALRWWRYCKDRMLIRTQVIKR